MKTLRLLGGDVELRGRAVTALESPPVCPLLERYASCLTAGSSATGSRSGGLGLLLITTCSLYPPLRNPATRHAR